MPRFVNEWLPLLPAGRNFGSAIQDRDASHQGLLVEDPHFSHGRAGPAIGLYVDGQHPVFVGLGSQPHGLQPPLAIAGFLDHLQRPHQWDVGVGKKL